MNFADSMQAKEFLVARIAEEARRRHIELSELERKMLYFSETYPTLPDMMEVAEKFEGQYNDAEYEEKIRRLAKEAFERDRKEWPENVQRWREAIRLLKKEDHYILVMLDVPRSGADVVKLAAAGLILTAVLASAIAAMDWGSRHIHLKIPDQLEVGALVLLLAALYYLSLSKTGAGLSKDLGDLIMRAIRWF